MSSQSLNVTVRVVDRNGHPVNTKVVLLINDEPFELKGPGTNGEYIFSQSIEPANIAPNIFSGTDDAVHEAAEMLKFANDACTAIGLTGQMEVLDDTLKILSRTLARKVTEPATFACAAIEGLTFLDQNDVIKRLQKTVNSIAGSGNVKVIIEHPDKFIYESILLKERYNSTNPSTLNIEKSVPFSEYPSIPSAEHPPPPPSTSVPPVRDSDEYRNSYNEGWDKGNEWGYNDSRWERELYDKPWKFGLGDRPNDFLSENGESIDPYGEGYWDGYISGYVTGYKFFHQFDQEWQEDEDDSAESLGLEIRLST